MIEKLKLEVERLKLLNEHNGLKIKNYQNQIKELEKEKSPAEEYLRKMESLDYLKPLSFASKFAYKDRNIIAGITIKAHEAGQEFGAKKEAEKYENIIVLAEQAAVLLDANNIDARTSNFLKDEIYKIWHMNKRRKLNPKPKEKPEIVGNICGWKKHKLDVTEISLELDYPLRTHVGINTKYKLTPIEN